MRIPVMPVFAWFGIMELKMKKRVSNVLYKLPFSRMLRLWWWALKRESFVTEVI